MHNVLETKPKLHEARHSPDTNKQKAFVLSQNTPKYSTVKEFLAIYTQKCNKDKTYTKVVQNLTKIWEDGARATHSDLSEEEIARMKNEIQEHIATSQHILIAHSKDCISDIFGFIAVQNDTIEMLFIAPQYFRKGLGKSLIKEAYARYLRHFVYIKVCRFGNRTQCLRIGVLPLIKQDIFLFNLIANSRLT